MTSTTATSALQTDRYELTMLSAARRSGLIDRRAVFEVFARKLPDGRRYGVFGGLGRLLDEIDAFRFGAEELAYLASIGFDDPTLEWLGRYRFTGDVVAYREGELYFPHSPVLTVEATFGEAVVLETLVLSVLNHDTAIASAAARMVAVAEGRPLLEMGGRRTHEDAAVSAARMAHLVGFSGTSNLEAGRRYGIPTIGTAAHAFTLAHADEADAFASQLDTSGLGTTLLVDTYDIPTAIRTAVRLAIERGASGPGAVRIDSGDLADEAERARQLLDELGATDTRIVVSGDLDEYLIEDLVERRAPIDSFGVGTKVVTGSGHPTASFVYKLVAIADDTDPDGPLRPVAKRSVGKVSVGGRKLAWRRFDDDGHATAEHVEVVEVAERAWPEEGAAPTAADGPHRPLQVRAVIDGERRHRPSADEVRAHHAAARAELRPLDRMIVAGPPALSAVPVPRRSTP
jgi:nicotinate phosphoribosyltransferase